MLRSKQNLMSFCLILVTFLPMIRFVLKKIILLPFLVIFRWRPYLISEERFHPLFENQAFSPLIIAFKHVFIAFIIYTKKENYFKKFSWYAFFKFLQFSMIKRRWNSYHSKYAIKTIDILKFSIERMAKVQSYPLLEGWRQGQCRYFQFCMCHRGDLYVDQFRIANWYLLTNFVFFEKHNETILGRECNETVFQPCDINWSPKKTTKSWRDVGIWKKKQE